MIHDSQLFQPTKDEPISVIDGAGAWTGPNAPDLDDHALVRLYHDMVVGRMMDERLSRLQRQGKTSFVAPSAGHEAAQAGIASALHQGGDWLFPYYRDTTLVLAFGVPMVEMIGQAMGNLADPAKGRQMPAHPASAERHVFSAASPIASHIPPAVGTAISMKLRATGQVAVATFGDGATSEGDFHAALNFAGVQGAPIVFACQNNGYAISVDYHKQSGSESIAAKAAAYGMPGYVVDGMDVLACAYVMREAVARARSGLGPSLVEMKVYRYGAHSSSDDDSGYRPRAEVEAWKRRDPLPRYRLFLEGRGLWDEAREEALRAEVGDALTSAVKEAEAAGPVPTAWMFEDVFERIPAHLEEQRDGLLG